MVNDKDLRELLELISSIRLMLKDAKKNDKANYTSLKLFDNLSSSLCLYQDTIINLNDEIEQQSKQHSISLIEIAIEIEEMKSSIENTKDNASVNYVQDMKNNSLNIQLRQKGIEYKIYNLKLVINYLKTQFYILKPLLEDIKNGKSPLLLLIDTTINIIGFESKTVAALKSLYDFLNEEHKIWNTEFENLSKNSDIGFLEILITALVTFSYVVIAKYSNSDRSIKKDEWIQLKREALPVVKMYIENYIPKKHDDNKNLIDDMKKFIQES